MEKNTSYEDELQNRIKREMEEERVKERANRLPLFQRIDYIAVLTFLIGMIALSLALWIILPVSLDYDFHFKNVVHFFHLRYIFQYLPYIGLLTFFVLLFKKRRHYWLLAFSLFSILFPFYMPTVKYINQNFHTNMSERLQDNTTPLLMAVKSSQMDKTRELLENGANPNETYTYDPEVIFLAARKDNLEMVKLLLQFGAKANIFNYYDGTPLHVAVNNNNYEMVKLLLKNHAPVNFQTKFHDKKRPAFTRFEDFGRTPLHFAVINNNPQIAKLLLENGANMSIMDKSQKTAYDYAKDGNMDGVFEVK